MARLVWAFLLLVACTCSSTHASEPSAKSAKSLHQPQQLLSRRDAFELAQEREQVLAAQQSIASWRQTLHQHGRPAVDEPGTADPHDESELQRPEQRRRRRRKRADPKEGGLRNETLGPEGPTDPDDGGDDPDASVVCYGPLGCFHETEHLPEMLPSSPAEVSTRFLVYTTTHRSEKPLIEFTYEELVVAGFGAAYWANGTNDTVSIPVATGTSSTLLQTFGDLSNRTVRVIVHGFGSNCGLVWIYEMRTALMAVENCTVICVDWENGAKLPNYVRAAANTRLVGRQLALLLRLLRTHNGLRLSRVHLIGFSLGSHVAGFAGAEFSTPSEQEEQMETGEQEKKEKEKEEEEHDGEEQGADADELQRTARAGNPSAHPGTERPASRAGLWRITGLDPAGPLFEAQPPEVRLDAGDARYVDVIHSNGENLILGGLGSWQPMGTVDYYPNGGRVQHGCTNLFVGAVTDIIWAPPTTVEGRSLCNHRRAYKFFIDSVAPRCHFPAFPCESYDQFAAGECFDCGNGTARSACGRMGYYATSRDVGGYGQLYLRTRDEEPYCANQFRLRLRNAPDELPLRTVGRFELTLEGGDTGNGIEDGQPSGGGGAAAPPLLTFNETFHLDEAREDREFHAGQWLTTILVPHPALGHRPRALTITYRPYRGGWWQRSSVGKQLWRIGPILLTADDQRTYGSCATLTLQADVPVRIELQSILLHTLDEPDEDGIECRAAEELNHPAHTAHTAVGASGPAAAAAAASPPAPPKPPKSSIDELTVGSKHPAGHDHFSWTPVAISIPRHSPQPVHVNEKRSFSDAVLPGQQEQQDATAPGQQPLLPPTAQTVQLFPSRLVSFFERAERYARRTWDALFSGNGTDGTNGLLPKLAAPPPDAATDEATVATSVPELLLMSPARHSEASGAPPPATGSSPAPGTSTLTPPTEPPTTSTEIRIALPTFRPMGRTLAPDGAVGSGRQHYTRFIPLVYEEGRDAVAASTAGARKAAARSR